MVGILKEKVAYVFFVGVKERKEICILHQKLYIYIFKK